MVIMSESETCVKFLITVLDNVNFTHNVFVGLIKRENWRQKIFCRQFLAYA